MPIVILVFGVRMTNAQVNPRTLTLLEEAKTLTQDSLYDAANLKYLEAINSSGVLPDDFCFFFGENLYFSNHNKKSIAFLEKYIDLRGEQGEHYKRAIHYLNLLQPKQTEIVTNPETGDTTKLIYKQPEKPDPCEGGEKFICPICDGKGVIIRKGGLGGDSYQSCEFSDPDGYMDCEHYKLYLKGTPKKY